MENRTVIVKGGGDIGTGVCHRLRQCGFRVLVLEIEKPTVVRRKAAFAQAVYDGSIEVEGVTASRASDLDAVRALWSAGQIPVVVDPRAETVAVLRAPVLIDATLAKRNTGMHKHLASITVALGPGFRAGIDADAVIETKRGHDLGRVIYDGCAEADTGIPEAVGGYDLERVLRSPCNGRIGHVLDIGCSVTKGALVCHVGARPVAAPIGGIVRGLIMEGLEVVNQCKIGDIDPRGVARYCYSISDKARAVGGGVLEAILCLQHNKHS